MEEEKAAKSGVGLAAALVGLTGVLLTTLFVALAQAVPALGAGALLTAVVFGAVACILGVFSWERGLGRAAVAGGGILLFLGLAALLFSAGGGQDSESSLIEQRPPREERAEPFPGPRS